MREKFRPFAVRVLGIDPGSFTDGLIEQWGKVTCPEKRRNHDHVRRLQRENDAPLRCSPSKYAAYTKSGDVKKRVLCSHIHANEATKKRVLFNFRVVLFLLQERGDHMTQDINRRVSRLCCACTAMYATVNGRQTHLMPACRTCRPFSNSMRFRT